MRNELRKENEAIELEEQEKEKHSFPALYYRAFTYRDGRGHVQEEQKIEDNAL